MSFLGNQAPAVLPTAASQATEAASERAALAARAVELNARWQGASALEILRDAVTNVFPGRLSVVSSFGADAAVLLHMVSEVSKDTPILFIDTGKHFIETLMYRDILVGRFGFTDARALEPASADIAKFD